jgi:hypothetical protein
VLGFVGDDYLNTHFLREELFSRIHAIIRL